ncbi:hypothetical protein T09_761 [Trichinella sp. T9]|nr:hypothetical protein T09_761 [Trichinella sp. T9]
MKKKSKSGVDAVRNADGMMQNDKREKISLLYVRNMKNEEKKKRKYGRHEMQIADDTKQIADDTKRIADDTKQTKKR